MRCMFRPRPLPTSTLRPTRSGLCWPAERACARIIVPWRCAPAGAATLPCSAGRKHRAHPDNAASPGSRRRSRRGLLHAASPGSKRRVKPTSTLSNCPLGILPYMPPTASARFQHSFARLPEQLLVRVRPEPVAAPELVALNRSLAEALGFDPDWLSGPDGVAMLSGRRLPDTAEPLAMAYAGYQFGNWVP